MHQQDDEIEYERVRQNLNIQINSGPAAGPELDQGECRKLLEREHGQVWSAVELAREFDVLGFAAPLVCVCRRSDGMLGSMMFQHCPRFYWSFEPK
jgi:hypothetical protein